jgi:hypothetical protein
VLCCPHSAQHSRPPPGDPVPYPVGGHRITSSTMRGGRRGRGQPLLPGWGEGGPKPTRPKNEKVAYLGSEVFGLWIRRPSSGCAARRLERWGSREGGGREGGVTGCSVGVIAPVKDVGAGTRGWRRPGDDGEAARFRCALFSGWSLVASGEGRGGGGGRSGAGGEAECVRTVACGGAGGRLEAIDLATLRGGTGKQGDESGRGRGERSKMTLSAAR